MCKLLALSAKTGVAYAVTVFALGFLLGTARILVGAVAFATLTILEVALSISLFHRSIGEYLADLRSPAGVVGLAAQVCFATFPLFNVIVRGRLNLSGH